MVELTSHVHLVPSLKVHRAVPPLPQYVFITWCLIKQEETRLHGAILGKVQGNFTFYLYELRILT